MKESGIEVENLKMELAAAQALIQLMENLFSKAQPHMNDKEKGKYERFMVELRREESILMDKIFRAGGRL